ncbi:hypothetical protein DFH08DRAFT_1079024 [Mycena albidolilacea]|uniref:Uncharacterized protein n=1 Tax=Mycena albidolilacea TaxID=1033008 RepID=A0AAD7ESF8_9AGAR|nr:hypothetical protein DFH08DRAFT_1079024 [Mycena albidolilacea]
MLQASSLRKHLSLLRPSTSTQQQVHRRPSSPLLLTSFFLLYALPLAHRPRRAAVLSRPLPIPTPPYNFASVLSLSAAITDLALEHVCPSLCPALDLCLSLLRPAFAFLPFPPRLIPSHRSLPTYCATAAIHQYRLALSARADSCATLLCGSGSANEHGLAIHQAHTSPPILLSSSTFFPSRLTTYPALLASGPRAYDRAHALLARLTPFPPWTRSERADINNTDVCSGARGIIVLERADQRAATAHMPESDTLRTSPVLHLRPLIQGALHLHATSRFSSAPSGVTYLLICLPSPTLLPPAHLPATVLLLVHRHCACTRTRTRRPRSLLCALPASPLLLTPLLLAIRASTPCTCTHAGTGTSNSRTWKCTHTS